MNRKYALVMLVGALTTPPLSAQTPLVTGKQITPAGRQIEVGSFPANMILSPDGRFIAVTNTGYRQFLTILSAQDGSIRSRIEVGPVEPPGNGRPGLYYGLAFGPNGLLYASRGAEETVAVYHMDSTGHLTDTSKRLESRVKVTDKRMANVVAGVALNRDGKLLVVSDNNTSAETKLKGSVTMIDTATGRQLKRWSTAGFPLGVAVVSREQGTSATQGTPGVSLAGRSNGDRIYVASERDGVVQEIDLAQDRVVSSIRTGAGAYAILPDAAGSRIFVSNPGSDTVSIISTATRRATKTILLRPDDMRGLPGATPLGMALSANESRLYVALADMNAVGVVALPEGKMLGYIPTGWYPTSVVAAPGGKHLFISNAKGVVERNPNAKDVGNRGKYIENIIEGTVQVTSIPSAQELAAFTQKVIANNRIHLARKPVFSNPGIEHIIYIIKENRTYDQVLGDIPKGNGDPSLTLFPRSVTPNLHALAERFVLLDNFYCCAEVSADGWNWSTSGMANEYVERNAPYNYSGRGRVYDYEGTNNGIPVDLLKINDVARSPGGYLWDNAIRHGVSLRNYGFYMSFSDPTTRGKPDPRTNAVDNTPNKRALVGKTHLNYRQYDTDYSDSEARVKHNWTYPAQHLTHGSNQAPSRITEWRRDYERLAAAGTMPKLMLVRLGNDHTMGTRAGKPSPRALVADNDFAVGQLVETVSRSVYWEKTAIVVVEDDAQNGFDHVDAHRSIAFVITPFIAEGTVDSHFYNTDSALRTMELLLGLPPMCQYDAVAPPFGFLGKNPLNSAPYEAILPAREIVTEMNKPTAYRAGDSARFQWAVADSVPDDELNDILWHAIKGTNTPKPALRYSVRTQPQDDDDDEPRKFQPRRGTKRRK